MLAANRSLMCATTVVLCCFSLQLLVGFGQQVCLPSTPRCQQCTVNTWCPVGRVNVKRIARGLTPVRESKDEARAAAMKRAKKGGKRFTPVKYAKHDEGQLSLDAAGKGKGKGEGAEEEVEDGVERKVEREAAHAEEQAERNAEIVAEESSAQEELKEEKAAEAIETRAESMEVTAKGTEKSGRQHKRKSVRGRGKDTTAEADEEKDDTPPSISSRTRTRGKRLQL